MEDSSGCGRTDRTRLRFDHRRCGALSVREAGGELSGLVPLEKSSGNRRRLGHITQQGSSMLRFLLVEAAQVTVRSLPEWRSRNFRLMMRRGPKTGKVAMARRLAIGLYWMWRQRLNYEQLKSSVRTQESPEIAMV